MKRFEPNKTYYCRSLCNYDCVWTFFVTRRTEKTIYVREDGEGEEKALRVSVWNDEETAKPLGRYSMAPTLSAGRVC